MQTQSRELGSVEHVMKRIFLRFVFEERFKCNPLFAGVSTPVLLRCSVDYHPWRSSIFVHLVSRGKWKVIYKIWYTFFICIRLPYRILHLIPLLTGITWYFSTLFNNTFRSILLLLWMLLLLLLLRKRNIDIYLQHMVHYSFLFIFQYLLISFIAHDISI